MSIFNNTVSDFRVVSQIPEHHASDVNLAGVMTITFNQPINTATANFNTISYNKVVQPDSGTVTPVQFTITFSADNLSIILTPDANLDPGSEYSVIIRGINDASGHQLKSKLGYALRFSFVSRFRTSDIRITTPVLVDPDNASSIEAPVTLEWEPSVVSIWNEVDQEFVNYTPTNYQVVVGTDPSFATSVYNTISVNTNSTIGVIIQEKQTYYWKVRARYIGDDDQLQLSEWSEVFQFYLGFYEPGISFDTPRDSVDVDVINVDVGFGQHGIIISTAGGTSSVSQTIVDDGIFTPLTESEPLEFIFAEDIDTSLITSSTITIVARDIPFHRGRPRAVLFDYAVNGTDSTLEFNKLVLFNIDGGYKRNVIYTITIRNLVSVDTNILISNSAYSFIYDLYPLYIDWDYLYNYVTSYYEISKIDLARLYLKTINHLVDAYDSFYGTTIIPESSNEYIECFIINAILADLTFRDLHGLLADVDGLGGFTLGDLTIRKSSVHTELPGLVAKLERDADNCLGMIMPDYHLNYTVKSWNRPVPPSVSDHVRTEYMPQSPKGKPRLKGVRNAKNPIIRI